MAAARDGDRVLLLTGIHNGMGCAGFASSHELSTAAMRSYNAIAMCCIVGVFSSTASMPDCGTVLLSGMSSHESRSLAHDLLSTFWEACYQQLSGSQFTISSLLQGVSLHQEAAAHRGAGVVGRGAAGPASQLPRLPAAAVGSTS